MAFPESLQGTIGILAIALGYLSVSRTEKVRKYILRLSKKYPIAAKLVRYNKVVFTAGLFFIVLGVLLVLSTNNSMTVLIALVATYIAYQQWRTNELRLKHELYERRLKVYKDLRKLLNEAPNANYDTVMLIFDSLTESDFLFDDDEIPKYLQEIWEKTNKLASLPKFNPEEDYVSDYHKAEMEGYEKERLELTSWFHQQYDVAKGKFKKYLQLR